MGDLKSVELLKVIHSDEITHVAAGQKWFSHFVGCHERIDKYEVFHTIVKRYFWGYLKPPFNEHDRAIAGLDITYYLPLVAPEK